MSNIDLERVIESEKKTIAISAEYKDIAILDMGGGGEGIIGKLYGKNVIAIDRSMDELNETNNESIKIAMDACDMKFVQNQFELATSFFTLMYMGEDEKAKVISEVYRVLKPEGVFEIWDTVLPKYDKGKKDIYILQLDIILPSETIHTGYGVFMNSFGQDDKSILAKLNEQGFKILLADIQPNGLFHIKCCK